MSQRRQRPWWWRSEVLGQVAMALFGYGASHLFGAAADVIPSLMSP